MLKKEEIELLMVSRLIDEVSFSSEEAIFNFNMEK